MLDAWAASPARFREDANAEEDLVRGGYRDRLLVELAQNAADAARAAGVPGRLRLELADDVLRAANTGAPLDAAGVQGLATLRASGKRDEPGSVGRFGVGFAAVLAVTDEPAVVSRSGGVRFSAEATRAEVAALPSLAEEVARRDGTVPVLRLPWPAEGTVPPGFDTEVVLPLRAGTRDAVARVLADLPADLLLALPGLAEVEVVVDGRTRTLRIEEDGARVRLRDGDDVGTLAPRATLGELAAEVLADRPVEERNRRSWTVVWAVPLDGDGSPRPLTGRQVVHAPTPSDEPLSIPARLIAPFPLGPDRRHVVPGPATDALVDAAAAAFADLVTGLPPDPVLLALVPRVGLAGAELDARLCSAVLDVLRTAEWLPAAEEETDRQSPARAVALDDATDDRVAALAGVLPGLLPADWSRRADGPALAALGVRRVGLAEAVEAVRGIERPGDWWARLYAALDGADREEIAALPVPLADGRTAHGPAGVLLGEPGLPVERLAPLGLRLADPEAVATPGARRVLERLGAQPATAAAVLADPTVRAAVEHSMDAIDEFDSARSRGVRAGGHRAGRGGAPRRRRTGLAGRARAARRRRRLGPGRGAGPAGIASRDRADRRLARRPGTGVRRDHRPGRAPGGRRARHLPPRDRSRPRRPRRRRGGGVGRRRARPAPGRGAATGVAPADRRPRPRARGRLAGSARAPRRAALCGARRRRRRRGAGAQLPALVALDAPRAGRDAAGPAPLPGQHGAGRPLRPGRGRRRQVLALLRPPATLDDVLADADGAIDLLARLGDLRRTVRPDVLRTVYARLAVALDGVDVDPPEWVRTTPERVARDAVVLDAPYLLPLVDLPVVPAGGAPGPVADLLDLPLAGELVRASVTSRAARSLPWSQVPGAALAAARLGRDELTGEIAVHEPLTVDGRPVAWWPGEDVDHVDGTPAALGRALAWREGVWSMRQALAEAFAHPDRAAELAAEDAVGD